MVDTRSVDLYYNPIISMYLLDMFDIRQTSNTELSHVPLTLILFNVGMIIKCL